jgi:molecular chaperone DnaK
MKDKNTDSVKRGMEELTKVSHKLAEEIYKKTQEKNKGQGPGADQAQQGGQSAGGDADEGSAGKKDDVIDAEFTSDDDGKKGKR